MIYATQTFINNMKSPQKRLYLKLEFYDNNMNFIREITQKTDNSIGNLSVDGSSDIRRSFNLTLDNSNNEFDFGSDNLVWINKRIKLYVGISTWGNNVEFVPLGIFVLTDPSQFHTTDGKKVSITAVDKAYLFTGKRGKLINNLVIAEGADIVSTIKTIATDGGETLFNFDNVTMTVPYELSYETSENRWEVLKELATLANCTIFYDSNGYLRLKQIDLYEFDNEPITWEYKYNPTDTYEFYLGSERVFTESDDLYNDIVVLGGSSGVATSSYRLTVDENNPLWVNHPYSIQQIGRITYEHNNGEPDGILQNENDCKYRAKYELMKRLGFTETLDITAIPNYLHDADDVIYVEDEQNGIKGGKFIIQSFDLPLYPSAMSIQAVRYERVIDNWDFI